MRHADFSTATSATTGATTGAGRDLSAAPIPATDPFGPPIRTGGRIVRLAGPGDMPGVLALRGRAFRGGAEDGDAYDRDCLHLWVGADAPGAPPLATLRILRHPDARALLSGYVAQHYDLCALARAGEAEGAETLELGRLCVEPGSGLGAGGGDLLRLLWAGVTRIALGVGAGRRVGFTSVHSTDPASLDPAWSYLKARAAGPSTLTPGRKAPEIYPFEAVPAQPGPEGQSQVPPLLRAYLSLGGWVSDHAVIDRDLGTCHVFTCVDIAAMPPARLRILRQMAGLTP
ncbi:GNAT family N-acyltransferase [Pararhodobacter marinus]|uniref:GNAT family N-acyltransferase n=1 Tax=Pararhodobacter marinus TaxID=2184063 RepID=UPI0035191354